MIVKQALYCTEAKTTVETLVEEKTVRRGGKSEVTRTVMTCTRMTQCPRTLFCRFVNPLTTRIPLEAPEESSAAG